MLKNRPKPIVLVILDGWGVAAPSANNPITLAQTPNFDKFITSYPAMALKPLGGSMSSAAGHFIIGTGQDWRQPTLLDSQTTKVSLAKIISQAGFSQLFITETEKYVYLNYFFKGCLADKLASQEEEIIPSPLVSSYETEPAMSAKKITEKTLQAVNSGQFDFIAINFANADILGQTGNRGAAVKAVEKVDKCLGRLAKSILAKEGVMLITADHSRSEDLANNFGSANPVPFIMVASQWEGKNAGQMNVLDGNLSLVEPAGELVDVAPTILKIMGLAQPKEMIGKSLI